MKKDIEVRYINTELRANTETREITGYAIVFNTESENLGNFIEVIDRDAVTPELIANSDIKLLYNHDEMQGILARSKRGKGTLNISIDERGVKYSAILPNTTLGNDVLESIRRGDLDSCSFAFTLDTNGDNWTKIKDNLYKRTITKFSELFDFSVVVTPAYSSTSVSARALDKIKELEQKELLELDLDAEKQENQRKAQEQLEKDKAFNEYYNRLKCKYLK